MVLIDTSVLISYLNGSTTLKVALLDQIIGSKIPFGISQYTYTEILQGVATQKQFELLKSYLDTQSFFGLQLGNESFAQAALLYYRCKKQGITIRSTIDLLIARIAIENELYLLADDKDFDNIAKVIPDLKLYPPH